MKLWATCISTECISAECISTESPTIRSSLENYVLPSWVDLACLIDNSNIVYDKRTSDTTKFKSIGLKQSECVKCSIRAWVLFDFWKHFMAGRNGRHQTAWNAASVTEIVYNYTIVSFNVRTSLHINCFIFFSLSQSFNQRGTSIEHDFVLESKTYLHQ